MDSLADLWVRSGKNPQRLYQGSKENIIEELKAWVGRRKANNDANMDVSWDMFRVMDSIQQLSNQPEGVEEAQIPGMMDQISTITATQMANLDRNRNLEKEKDRETLLANFFLASLRHRGIRWPQISHTERTQADAGVCAFLGTVDDGFNAKTELDILEDNTRITQWQAELERRDAIRAREIANDPIPGVNTHPIGLVGARIRQEFANDPTISTRQAFTNAADGIMLPGAVDFLMGSNSTGTTNTPSTTGEATRPTGENATTTDDTAVYIADMLGNINMATGPSSSTAANAPLNMNNAASSSSSNAAVTFDITNITPGASSSIPADAPDKNYIATVPSSSTVTEPSANRQTLSGAEGQGQGTKMSKAKKKREGRKRAKAAQAKEAAESARTSVSNHDEDDGEVPDPVDV